MLKNFNFLRKNPRGNIFFEDKRALFLLKVIKSEEWQLGQKLELWSGIL